MTAWQPLANLLGRSPQAYRAACIANAAILEAMSDED